MKATAHFFACVLAATSLSTPALAKEETITGLALQQIQARDFETSVDFLFPSIVTVLQDAGYRITEADKISGFVSGIGSSEQKLTFNIWFGFGKKKYVPMVSAFVEQRGPNIARARLNFVMSKAKSRNIYTDEKPITDPGVYKDAFERIEKEIFVRQAMNAPAPASKQMAETGNLAKGALTDEGGKEAQKPGDPIPGIDITAEQGASEEN